MSLTERCSAISATKSAIISGTFWSATAASSRRSAVFGDETWITGGAAKHYANGAPPNWQENFISAYATSHPWEDFAETWAHYLHIVDTLEMARAFGMYVHPRLARPGELDAQVDFDPYAVRDSTPLIETWLPLSNALNSLNRTMGLSDIYPFVLSPRVDRKAHRDPRSHSRQYSCLTS